MCLQTLLIIYFLFSHSTTWVEILGTTYKPGGIVILSADTLPTFGVISDIIIFNTTNYFLVTQVMHTVCFNSHFHGYEVEFDEQHYTFVKQENLVDHNVLGLYKKTDNFVVLKYAIPSHT